MSTTITRKKLAKLYGCDYRTLANALKEIVGINHGRKLFPLEVEMIRKRLGDWDRK